MCAVGDGCRADHRADRRHREPVHAIETRNRIAAPQRLSRVRPHPVGDRRFGAAAKDARGDSAAVVVPDGGPTDRRDGGLVVCALAPGATVLLSTAPIAGATALLGSGAALHPERLADLVVPGTNGLRGVAAVLYRHPPDPIAITLPAAPSNLAVSRERLRTWLAQAGVDPESCADVLLAVSPGHRGHGMQLINALVDSVELTTTPDGTTVAMLKEVP